MRKARREREGRNARVAEVEMDLNNKRKCLELAERKERVATSFYLLLHDEPITLKV